MSTIEWDQTFELGIESVDKQHHNLVDVLNELHDALSEGKAHKHMREILDRLVDYTQTHFDDEEVIMAEMGYPDLAAHKIEHHQLLEKVGKFQKKLDLGQERISRPVMDFLDYWLSKHILQTDMLIGEFARSQEQEEANTEAPV